jgi:hypothetical protein
MPKAYDPRFTALAVAPDVNDAPGSFIPVANMTTTGFDEGEDDPSEIKVFHSDIPYTKAGDDTLEVSLDGLIDLTDAGQNLLRTAKRAKTRCWVKITHRGVSGDEPAGVQMQCRVSSNSEGSEREGDFVTAAFSLTGIPGTLEEIEAES